MELQRAKLLALACAAAVSCGAYAQTSASDQAASPASSSTSPTSSSTSPTSSVPTSPTANVPTSPTSNVPSNASPNVPTNPTANVPTNPTAQNPATNPSMTPPPGTANSTTMGSSVNNQVFASLDRSHKGYLSEADVASNQYLSANFKRCDVNSDGRLSQVEVSTCMQGASATRR